MIDRDRVIAAASKAGISTHDEVIDRVMRVMYFCNKLEPKKKSN